MEPQEPWPVCMCMCVCCVHMCVRVNLRVSYIDETRVHMSSCVWEETGRVLVSRKWAWSLPQSPLALCIEMLFAFLGSLFIPDHSLSGHLTV